MVRRHLKPAFLVSLAGILYLISANSGAGWLYVVTAAVAATVVVSLPIPYVGVPARNVRGVAVSRRVPASGNAGEPLRCAMEVRSTALLGRYLLEIEDRFAAGTGRGVVARVHRDAPEVFEYEVEAPHRGIYSGGEVTVESSAPFGLFAVRRRLQVASACVVYPKVFDVADLPPPASGEEAGGEKDEAAALHRGLGGEFWGVREYRPGDPARLIAWRQSARSLATGRLSVVELARETDPPFVLTLDLDPRAPAAAREMVVSAGASLLLAALREGREVSADAGPQRLPFPEVLDPDAMLTWCAGLEASRPPRTEGASIRVMPSLRDARPGGSAGATVLVSCHEFAGSGPWMTPEEEDGLLASVEASGRRAARLGPDVAEPWRIS